MKRNKYEEEIYILEEYISKKEVNDKRSTEEEYITIDKAQSLFINKEYQNVINELKNINDDTNRTLNYLLGVSYYYLKEYNKAINFIEKAIKIYKSPGSYYFLGKSYYEIEDYKNAIKAFEKAIELEEAMGQINDLYYFSLGLVYYKIEKYDNAIKIFKKIKNEEGYNFYKEAQFYIKSAKWRKLLWGIPYNLTKDGRYYGYLILISIAFILLFIILSVLI